MKKYLTLFLFLSFFAKSYSQLTTGEYPIIAYSSLCDDKVVRNSTFDTHNTTLEILNNKFVSVVVNGYPFYAWKIDKIIDKKDGTFAYYLSDVRDATPRFCTLSTLKDSTIKEDVSILHIYWSDIWIDELYYLNKPL